MAIQSMSQNCRQTRLLAARSLTCGRHSQQIRSDWGWSRKPVSLPRSLSNNTIPIPLSMAFFDAIVRQKGPSNGPTSSPTAAYVGLHLLQSDYLPKLDRSDIELTHLRRSAEI